MNRLREFREARGLSQQQVADHCGWQHGKVSKMETGFSNTKVSDLIKLAGLYRVHPGELIAPLPEPPVNPRRLEMVERIAESIQSQASELSTWQTELRRLIEMDHDGRPSRPASSFELQTEEPESDPPRRKAD